MTFADTETHDKLQLLHCSCTKSMCDETLSGRLAPAQIMRHDPRSGEIMATLGWPSFVCTRIPDNDLINVES